VTDCARPGMVFKRRTIRNSGAGPAARCTKLEPSGCGEAIVWLSISGRSWPVFVPFCADPRPLLILYADPRPQSARLAHQHRPEQPRPASDFAAVHDDAFAVLSWTPIDTASCTTVAWRFRSSPLPASHVRHAPPDAVGALPLRVGPGQSAKRLAAVARALPGGGQAKHEEQTEAPIG